MKMTTLFKKTIFTLLLIILLINCTSSNLSTLCPYKNLISAALAIQSESPVTQGLNILSWTGIQLIPITVSFSITSDFYENTVYSIYISSNQQIQINAIYAAYNVDINNIVQYHDQSGSTFRYQVWFRNKQNIALQITPQLNGEVILNYQVFFANAYKLNGLCTSTCTRQHFQIKLDNQISIPTAICYDDFYYPFKSCNPQDIIDYSDQITVSILYGQCQNLGDNLYKPSYNSSNQAFLRVQFNQILKDQQQIYSLQVLSNSSLASNFFGLGIRLQVTNPKYYSQIKYNTQYKFYNNIFILFKGNDFINFGIGLTKPSLQFNNIIKITLTKFSVYGYASCLTVCPSGQYAALIDTDVIKCSQGFPFNNIQQYPLKYQCNPASQLTNFFLMTPLNQNQQKEFHQLGQSFFWKSYANIPFKWNLNLKSGITQNLTYQFRIIILSPSRVELNYEPNEMQPNIFLQNINTYDTLQRNQVYIITKSLPADTPIKIKFLSDFDSYNYVYIILTLSPVLFNDLSVSCYNYCYEQLSFLPPQITEQRAYCGDFINNPLVCLKAIPLCNSNYCQYITPPGQFQCSVCIGQLSPSSNKKSCVYNCSDFHCLSCSADTQGIIKCTSCLDYYGLNLSTQKCIPCPGGVNCINCAQKQWSITKGKITTNYNEFVCTKCANGSLPRQSNKAPYYTCR